LNRRNSLPASRRVVTLLLAFSGLVFQAGFAQQVPPGYLVVDGSLSNPSPPYFDSITAAVGVAAAGDIIQIRPMAESGAPIGYCEGNTGESFPINITTPGLTIRGIGSVPPLIYSEVGADLFSVSATLPSGGLSARFERLDLLGSSAAFNLTADGVLILDVELDQLRFSHNLYGVTGLAQNGGDLRLDTEDCWFSDLLPTIAPGYAGPASPVPLHGVSLLGKGNQTTQAHGTVGAEFTNLRSQGDFPGTELNPGSSLVLLKVEPGGNPRFPTHTPISFPEPVPTLIATFNGGDLVGRSSENFTVPGGWNRGISVISEDHPLPSGEGGVNYHSYFIVDLNGTKVSRFLSTGIWCRSGIQSQGRLKLNGGTEISRTRWAIGSSNGSTGSGTGVYLESEETYLGFKAVDTAIHHNVLDGVMAHCRTVSNRLETFVPMGLFFQTERITSSHNGRHGVNLVAGEEGVDDRGAFVGLSFWLDQTSTYSNQTPQILFHSPGAFGPLQGLGLIHECLIHHNGGSGIRMKSVDGIATREPWVMVGTRVLDCFIWDNHLEGFLAELGDASRAWLAFVHDTFAGNGDGAGASMEINASSGTFLGWIEIDPAKPGRAEFYSSIRNCIFQRKSTGEDLGAILVSRGQDHGSIYMYRIILSALRSKTKYDENQNGNGMSKDNAWTNEVTPFLLSAGFNWASSSWTDFLLDVNQSTFLQFFSDSGPIDQVNGLVEGLVELDRQGDSRDPGNWWDGNKGADEAD